MLSCFLGFLFAPVCFVSFGSEFRVAFFRLAPLGLTLSDPLPRVSGLLCLDFLMHPCPASRVRSGFLSRGRSPVSWGSCCFFLAFFASFCRSPVFSGRSTPEAAQQSTTTTTAGAISNYNTTTAE